MLKSLLQLMRTPWRCTLFFLLIALSTALVTIGLAQWRQASAGIRQADEAFVTIGAVRQRENTMSRVGRWDGALGETLYYSIPVYNTLISADVLQASELDYVSGPEHRPYYGAVSPDFVAVEDAKGANISAMVAEIRPLEDGIPSEPMEVELVRLLWGGTWGMEGQTIFFCDHYTEQPRPLEAGKTYIAVLTAQLYNADKHDNPTPGFEYAPLQAFREQDGLWDEVGNGYYDTMQGRRWHNLIEVLRTLHGRTVPVTPTDDTQLLFPFHQGEATILEGRDIYPEEYAAGEKVCLVPQEFARFNGLSAGDAIRLELCYTDYANAPCQISYLGGGISASFPVAQLTAEDKPYGAFASGEYTIVGVYAYHTEPTVYPTGYALAPNEIIIPARSVPPGDDQHVTEQGPMRGFNASFRIKNGTADAFIEAFQSLPESQSLEIQFYDNGYAQIAAGLGELQTVGVVLFTAGLGLAAAAITLFLYFAIIKQRRRTAVERAMGMTKGQCVVSLLAGVLVLTAAGAILGALCGTFLSGMVRTVVLAGTEVISFAYTKGAQGLSDAAFSFPVDSVGGLGAAFFLAAGEIVLVSIVSLVLIGRNLKTPPIYLLGGRS